MPFPLPVGGGVGVHDILSTDHPDTDDLDVPALGDVLTWDGLEWDAQPGGAGVPGAPGLTIPGPEGEPGEPGLTVPGAEGAAGAPGAPGAPGLTIPGPEGPEGEWGSPGPPGAGIQGPQGPAGPQAFAFITGEEGEPGPMGIPGPKGDTGPAGGGGGSATGVEVDLGNPAWSGRFTIVDAAILTTSKVPIWQAPGPYTGKGTRADEAAMDRITAVAAPVAGSAEVFWQTEPMLTPDLATADGARDISTLVPLATAESRRDRASVRGMRRLGKVTGNVKFVYQVLA